MRTLLARLSVFSLLCFAFFACQLSQASHALFKVEKGGHTSYLFGTVHVGTPDMQGLPNKVLKAIKSSNKVVVEVNMAAISPAEIQQQSAQYMLLPAEQTLADSLTADNYTKLTSYLKSKGLDIQMFSRHSPWAVMITILQIEYQQLGFSEQHGIDKQILKYAMQQNKAILELETLAQQLSIFKSLEAHSNAMLEETFKHMTDLDTYFVDLVQAWKQGDMDKLAKYYKMTFDDSKYGQFSEQTMLIARNKAWMEQLPPLLSKQSLFIAVGALHLPEKHGLIQQLQQAGFSVSLVD